MGDMLESLGMSPFELTIAFIVALIVIGIWLFNRRQSGEGKKIDIPTEALVLIVTIVAGVTLFL